VIGLSGIYTNCDLVLVKEACCSSGDNEDSQKSRPKVETYPWNWIVRVPNCKISYKARIVYPKKKAS
jgi:hypothetical protein